MASKGQLATALFGTSAVAVGYYLWQKQCRAKQATISALYIFPIKSCRGIPVEMVELEAAGLKHDREYMVVRTPESADAKFDMETLTIREYPRLAAIQPSFTADGKLMISTDDGKSIVAGDSDKKQTAMLWRTICNGVDQGEAVSKFLTAYLGAEKPVRLFRITEDRKHVDCSKYGLIMKNDMAKGGILPLAAGDDGGVARLSDWSELSIISTQTIQWLNQEPGMWGRSNLRFRMNIVVDAAEAFAEDKWHTFSTNRDVYSTLSPDVDFQYLKMCGRCQVPNTDPQTGERDPKLEPLKTLKRGRGGVYPFLPAGSGGVEPFFGVNLRHFHKPGQVLRVGDKVTVTSTRSNKGWW